MNRVLKNVLAVLILLVSLVALGAGVIGFFWIKELNRANGMVGDLGRFKAALQIQPSLIKSADGVVLYKMIDEDRKWVPLSEIPQIIQQATIAAEDKRFYEHGGIDPQSFARVLFTSGKEGRVTGGASTLTMQLAKRLFSEGERTFQRKIQDMALAVTIEQQYTKDQILELYLNQVFYGSRAYGISRAAEIYFNKPLNKVSISEAAMLARLVRKPSSENPFANYEKSLANRNDVLDIMFSEGFITKSEYAQAKAERPKIAHENKNVHYGIRQCNYFVNYVLEVLEKEHPEMDIGQGGYVVETTIDTKVQAMAEEQVQRFVHRFRHDNVRTGAFLITDRNGKIVAMVGGPDYQRNQFNVVVKGRRQPGSSFKPYVYALADAKGILRDYVSNAPVNMHLPGGGWYRPKNSGRFTGGTVSLESAVQWSINLPAVHTLDEYAIAAGNGDRSAGWKVFVQEARRRFGITGTMLPVPSLALGTAEVSLLDMARGYSVFQRRGTRVDPYAVVRITTQDGQTIQPTQELGRTSNVLSSSTADRIDGLMRRVVLYGTGRAASYVDGARGKTGTTNDNKDAWFCGYTDKFIGIGWIANEQKVALLGGKYKWAYPPMDHSVMGGSHTAEMWAAIMSRVSEMADAKHPGAPEDEQRVRTVRSDTSDDERVAPERDSQRTRSNEPAPDRADEPQQDPDKPQNENGLPNDFTPKPSEEPPPTPDATRGRPNESTNPPAEPPKRTEPSRTAPDSRPSKPKSNDREEGGTITVMVCADSGMLATDRCPNQQAMTYRKGSQPKRRCRIH
ncbi:MAG: transglycosylase domain-containing protein [Armatimonadetes bacterium]|nr:transglycosylase domain-containing protein [Armatimonadota bacterium]